MAACGAVHARTRPYRPQTSGKVERLNHTLLNHTLLNGWADAQARRSNQQRTAALAAWLHLSNHHRAHTALGSLPSIGRIYNGLGSYT